MTARHPEPPADPAKVRPLIKRFVCAWFRIHAKSHDPVHFGNQPHHRFDAPGGEFGVLYVGRDAHCAFMAPATKAMEAPPLATLVSAKLAALATLAMEAVTL